MKFGISNHDANDNGHWKRWFAWRPVQISVGESAGKWVWFEFVKRARDVRGSYRYYQYWAYINGTTLEKR